MATERSMHSINWLKNFFNKDDISITLINVMETILTSEMMIQFQFQMNLIIIAKDSKPWF